MAEQNKNKPGQKKPRKPKVVGYFARKYGRYAKSKVDGKAKAVAN